MRDLGLLESAVMRSQQTFGGKDLYPTLILKAAALIHSLLLNHVFVDGNKRTGFESARLLLILNGFDVKYSLDEAARFCFDVGSGKVNEKEVMEWLLKRMKLLKGRA